MQLEKIGRVQEGAYDFARAIDFKSMQISSVAFRQLERQAQRQAYDIIRTEPIRTGITGAVPASIPRGTKASLKPDEDVERLFKKALKKNKEVGGYWLHPVASLFAPLRRRGKK